MVCGNDFARQREGLQPGDWLDKRSLLGLEAIPKISRGIFSLSLEKSNRFQDCYKSCEIVQTDELILFYCKIILTETRKTESTFPPITFTAQRTREDPF